MHTTAHDTVGDDVSEELNDRLFSLMRELSALPVEARFRYALHVASNLVEGVGLASANRIDSRFLADLLLIATQLDEISVAIRVDAQPVAASHLRLC